MDGWWREGEKDGGREREREGGREREKGNIRSLHADTSLIANESADLQKLRYSLDITTGHDTSSYKKAVQKYQITTSDGIS